LKNVTRLDTRYNNYRALFRDYLRVPVASIRHIVDEICSLGNTIEPERCLEVLRVLSSFLAEGSTLNVYELQRLRSTQTFPVVQVGAEPLLQNTGPRITLRALNDTNWYIPDKTTLRIAFETRVELLTFSVLDI
jgi:hypothetical protein